MKHISGNQWLKLIPGCIGGNILELYDFIIYGYFADIMGKLFFPASNHYSQLMMAFAVLATGSLIRPFSAIIFGLIGDRYGRKPALLISIGCMAVSTLGLGLLPTYEQIGLLATTLLVFCKVLQGLSITSEEVGAAIFLMESVPRTHRAVAGSLVLGSVYIGLLIGAVVASITYLFINSYPYTWRIPFILGGLIGLVLFFIRLYQPESVEFKDILKQSKRNRPLLTLIKKDLHSTIKITLLFSLLAVAVYLYAVYLPSTLKSVESINKSPLILICSLGFISTFLISVVTGKFIDKFNTQTPLFVSLIGFTLFSFPIFLLLTHTNIYFILVGYLAFSILIGINAGSLMPIAINAFSVGNRFLGTCFAFNLSMSIFGSMAPMFALYLLKATHNPASPAILLIFCSILSSLSLFKLSYINWKSNYDDPECIKNG